MLQHYEFLIQRISKRHMRGLLKCEKFKYHAIKMMGQKVPNKKSKKKNRRNQNKTNKKENMEKANSTHTHIHAHAHRKY